MNISFGIIDKICFVTLFCVVISCGQHFFIVNKYHQVGYYCITNSSSALSWFDEDTTKDIDNEVSQFIPRAENSWKPSCQNNNVWECRESTSEDLILDRRWEAFQVHKTGYIGYNNEKLLKFTKVPIKLNGNFRIPISIRIEKEAHIFLCDGENVSESNCYWFLVQAFGNQTKTALRKCANGTIPNINNRLPQDGCRNLLRENTTSALVTNSSWSHFKLLRNGNQFIFTKLYKEKEETEVITFSDRTKIYNVTNVIIHSKHNVGRWKFHQISYFYITKNATDVQIGDVIKPVKGSVCISMFIKMCKFCKLGVSIRFSKKNTILHQETYEYKDGWQEIRFNTNNVDVNESLNVLISTTTTPSQGQSFWKLSNIEQCHKSGFRIISLNKPAKCQLISQYKEIVSIDNSIDYPKTINCEEDTVSKHCVPCSWFLGGECGQLKVCEKQSNTISCSCSAGYTGTNCDSECSRGHFGHQCNKTCECENSICNAMDGLCGKGCNNNKYRETNCNLRLLERPSINSVSYTEAIVHVTNSQLKNDNQKFSYAYIVQYKKNDANSWTTFNKSENYVEEKLIKITNLEPETKYFIRYIVTTDKNMQHFDNNLPKTEFSTKCDALTLDDLNVDPSNTSVNVTIKKNLIKTKCKFNKDYIRKSNYGIQHISVESDRMFLDKLIPYTNYTIDIFSLLKLDLKTTEGIPDKVQSLFVTDVSDSSVSLKWKKPDKIHGNLKHYVVEYKVLSSLGCNSIISSRDLITLNKSTTLENLLPFKNYSFTVYAVNSKFEGLKTTVNQTTNETDSIETIEVPQFNVTSKEARSIVITFYDVACDKIKGSMMIMIEAICLNTLNGWCNNVNSSFSYNFITTKHTLSGVFPFTNYKLKVWFCRSDYCDFETAVKHICLDGCGFKTAVEAPGPVRELKCYSKNKKSISIRWKAPDPPTGILKSYKITTATVTATATATKTQNVTNSPCKLWPDYQCVTLSNLQENTTYSVDVHAMNEEPRFYGQTANTRTRTIIEPSEKVKLTLDWTLQNDLEMLWNYPVEANGDIMYFNVSVLPISLKNKSIYESIEVTEYKPTYKHMIKQAVLIPSTIYRITIQAYNGLNGDPFSVHDLSPPPIPTFETEPIYFTTNNTIGVTISKVKNLMDNFKLFVLINTKEVNKDIRPNELIQFEQKFSKEILKFKVVYNCSKIIAPVMITVGEKFKEIQGCTYHSKKLSPRKLANFKILLVNTYKNKSSYKLYSYSPKKPLNTQAESKDLHLLGLLSLLLLIPIVLIIVLKRQTIIGKYYSIKKRVSSDNSTHPLAQEHLTPLTQLSVLESTYSKKVKVSELEQYIKDSLKIGELERQHALFPRGQTKPWECGTLKVNKSKNRYTNLLAYDHTRVVLKKKDKAEESDYINANYIDGYNVSKAYIATQGPKISTLQDFWRMIWQENVHYIFMLANIFEGEKKKVEKYWPDRNESLPFGEITVQFVDNQVFADYEHRVFKVTHRNVVRKVEQYHFSSWPDHGIPLYSQSLTPFLQNLQNIQLSTKSPVVVHCSAGVGRTGTILLCDICLRMASKENCVDMLHTLQQLRSQRPNMVDNVQQYKLAHFAILEYLVGLRTSIKCQYIDKEVEKLLKSGEISTQLQYLKNTAWQDETIKATLKKMNSKVIVKEKNRFQNIIPEPQSMVFLSRYPLEDDTSIYINAVTVDGFKQTNRFIVTQQPMPNTVGDFWRLIYEQEISVVLSLNKIDLKNTSSCYFWSSEKDSELTPVDYITLKHTKTVSVDSHDIITVHMHVKNDENYKVVEILSMKDWPAKKNCPKKIESFLAFWEESFAMSRHSNQVIVTCFDGALASGLYVSMSFVIEKIKLEQVCDVCQAVRTVRHNRSQFVQNEEQFAFLYKAAVAYVNEFEFYANFN